MKFSQRIKKILDTIDDVVDVAVAEATNETFAAIEERVFNQGKDSDGATIGKYSTKAMYATKNQFYKTSAFKPQGKGEHLIGQKPKTVMLYNIDTKKGKRVAVTKQSRIRNSMYLANGYKELRAIQGFQVGYIDMTVSGDLKNSLSRDKDSIFFKNDYGIKIGRALEKRLKGAKGTIFSITEEERENIQKIFKEEVGKLFKSE